MIAPSAALIWCPFPDAEIARESARVLLAERLVACANILPSIDSLFLWQGQIAAAAETAGLFKTTGALLDMAIARLAQLHPYEAPAILGWRADGAAPSTLAWLAGALAEGNAT